MKFCMRGQLADVISRAKFYLNQIRGFDSVGARIFGFSIRKRSRFKSGLELPFSLWCLWSHKIKQVIWAKLMRRATILAVPLHRFSHVYLQPFRCNSLLKCVSQA